MLYALMMKRQAKESGSPAVDKLPLKHEGIRSSKMAGAAAQEEPTRSHVYRAHEDITVLQLPPVTAARTLLEELCPPGMVPRPLNAHFGVPEALPAKLSFAAEN